MEIRVRGIGPPRKGSSLASAVVEVGFDEGHTVTVADIRVLRNRSGELWVALPDFVVQDGNAVRYEPTVTASRALLAEIQNAVLAAYEQKQSGGAI